MRVEGSFWAGAGSGKPASAQRALPGALESASAGTVAVSARMRDKADIRFGKVHKFINSLSPFTVG